VHSAMKGAPPTVVQGVRPCTVMRPLTLHTTSSGPRQCVQTCSAAAQATRQPKRAASQQQFEVSVCVNKTCKKQGSQQIAQFAQDLHLPGISVRTTGCLGKCGAGPNIAMDPPGVVLNHMATPARLAEALAAVAKADVSPAVLQATQLRLAGNSLARQGDLAGAVATFTKALELGVEGGRHLLLANRAGARQAMGDPAAALQDADEAAARSPPGFHTAYIRQVEIRAALNQYREAAEALAEAGERDPAFAKTADYKSLHKQLMALSS